MLALDVSDLKKSYGSQEILKGVNLKIEEGEFLGFLGHNGAGKSTTISIITGLIKKTSGNVKVFGYDIDLQPLKAKSIIGCVSQDYNFSQFETVRQVLLNQAGMFGISRKKALAKSDELLNLMDLEHVADKETRELSGGMKKRMMLSRAIISDPKLLILDEPTAGVDIGVRHAMWKYLKSLNNNKGTTIILTTHYLEEVEQLCHKVAILQNGIISQSATVLDLLNKFSIKNVLLDLKEKIPSNFNISGFKVLGEHTLVCSYNSKVHSFNDLLGKLFVEGFTVLNVRSECSALEQLFMDERN